MIELSVSIFGQTTGYRIHTVSKEPESDYQKFNKYTCTLKFLKQFLKLADVVCCCLFEAKI